MPGSELFYNYLVICFDRLLQSQQEYIKSYDHAYLFRFRVEIKKIRACLKCIENYYGKKGFQKTRKQLKKIFSRAGILRELQLYQAWFSKRHLLQLTKIIGLPEEIKERQEEFTGDSARIISAIQQNRRLVMRYARKLDQDKVYRFYIQVLKERLDLLQEELQEGKWHKTRKQIKQLRYARNWQDEKAKRILSKTQTGFLDQLQHLIGDWHDNEVMIKWLKEKQKTIKGRGLTGSKKSKNASPGEDRASAAFARAFHLMELTRKRSRELIKNKSKRSAKVLRPLAQRLSKVDKKLTS